MDSIGISIGIESLDLESISISIGIEFLTLDSISIVSVSKKLVSKVSDLCCSQFTNAYLLDFAFLGCVQNIYTGFIVQLNDNCQFNAVQNNCEITRPYSNGG